MEQFVLRDAVPGDMETLRDLFRRSALSNDADRPHLLAHPDALDLSELPVTQGRTRAALAQGRVVGFATWASAAGSMEIEDLFVDPQWMRQGAGRMLVTDLIERARAAGLRRIEVTANEQALGFYARLGFVAGADAQTRFGPAPRMSLALSP